VRCAGRALAALSCSPHPPQNSSPGSLMKPQLAHARDSGAPHLEQKRLLRGSLDKGIQGYRASRCI
jgi:hypothetical protein